MKMTINLTESSIDFSFEDGTPSDYAYGVSSILNANMLFYFIKEKAEVFPEIVSELQKLLQHTRPVVDPSQIFNLK